MIYGLGAGYSSSIRGLLASITEKTHHSLVFSMMGMLDIAGTLIGAVLWPTVYHLGLQMGGFYTGLPFAIASALLAFVLLSVGTAVTSLPGSV